jgi:hypothetical protein
MMVQKAGIVSCTVDNTKLGPVVSCRQHLFQILPQRKYLIRIFTVILSMSAGVHHGTWLYTPAHDGIHVGNAALYK